MEVHLIVEEKGTIIEVSGSDDGDSLIGDEELAMEHGPFALIHGVPPFLCTPSVSIPAIGKICFAGEGGLASGEVICDGSRN
ncbi:MAG: hypothetical protein ACN4GG_07475 [Akkermansiaceae bacterium]